jgi:aldose 1-epimerase
MSTLQDHPIAWLEHEGQRLGLIPSLGGSVAAWQVGSSLTPSGQPFDVWRPWNGQLAELNTTASFAMLPWCNRISGGGFTHNGVFHPVPLNRHGEPYPIHGDGWLQPWSLRQPDQNVMEMRLSSRGFAGNPQRYDATQRLELVPGGLDQTLTVTHVGLGELPYGLGLHPWFLRNADTQLQADVQGVWLSGQDPMPTGHTADLPPGWDLCNTVQAQGSFIDNTFTGWNGDAFIRWPDQGMQLQMSVPSMRAAPGSGTSHCLLYRPVEGPCFCFEPVTHPIDAMNLPGTPGMRVLKTGESLSLHVEWRWSAIPS